MVELNFTEQEIRENKESIITALEVSLDCYKMEREKINKDIRKIRAYLKKIKVSTNPLCRINKSPVKVLVNSHSFLEG